MQLRNLALAAALLLVPSCTVVRYHAPSLEAAPSGSTSVVHSLSFLWGIIPPQPISLEQCGPAGIQKMKVKQGLLDLIITDLTGGLIISYKVKMTCAASPAPK